MTTEASTPVDITTGITLTDVAAAKLQPFLLKKDAMISIFALQFNQVAAQVFVISSTLMIAIKRATSLAHLVPSR